MSKRKIGTVVLEEDVSVNDIEVILDFAIENDPALTTVSNQDGTYDVFISDSDE